MSSSNCCFLTCIQISHEADQVVWYSHLLKNFPQLIVIHTVKGLGIVSKAEIDVFLELSCFFRDPADVGNLISGSSAFSKTSLNIRKFTVHILLCTLWLYITCVTVLFNSVGVLLIYNVLISGVQHSEGFPGGISGEEHACQRRRHKRHRFDLLGQEDSPGGGHGNPLQ